ncbi:extracellular solute-binding protein [Paenibacillus thalictri]|uniref:Extracellular solute-binding protein n=1 Tax=Paenibacillus thalictri TaxID=2527873 RepID=A0A4V2J4B4_9BACL|nr:extracellular solute-binding protein [Paenibacillus thalictri]TBL79002.1 extracellular solute-binding protein [Paenibacillus thalictri]
MMKSKKWVAMVSAAALSAGALAGCSSGEPAKQGADNTPAGAAAPQPPINMTGFPIAKEPITIKMMGAKGPLHGEWKDMLVFKEYEKMTGIKVEFETVPQNGFVEKRNVKMAGGDLPDAFYRAQFTPADEVNYGSQGILIPLNGLIDKYAPNLKAVMEKYPEVRQSITAPDGNIYTLPQLNDQLAPRLSRKIFINKKWLDKLGLPVPATTEEYYNTLKAFRDNDMTGSGKKDALPWSGDKTFDILSNIRGSWGLGTTGATGDSFIDKGPDGKLRFFAIDPKYKELLEYLNKLYKEGLIDKDVFTQEVPQFSAKLTQGITGSFSASNVNQAGAKYMDDYVPLPALKGPYGDQLFSTVVPFTQTQGTFAITNKNKYPEATMRWVDYFYGDEGVKFLRMGMEGVTYEKTPDGSDIQYKEEIRANPKLSLDQAAAQFSPWPGGGIPQFVQMKYDKTGNTLPSSLESAKVLGPYVPKEIWPKFLFTKDEQDQLNSLNNDINTYVQEQQIKFVTGAVPFSNWDQYVASIKKMGVDKMLTIYGAAYDRYVKAKK